MDANGPQLAMTPEASGPQVAEHGPMVSSKEGYYPDGAQPPYQHEGYSYAGSPPAQYAPAYEKPPERTICGLRVATFILSVLLALVVIIAAVGGGVGATMAINNAREEAQASASAAIREMEVSGTAAAAVTVTVTASSTPTDDPDDATGGSSTTSSSFISVPTSGLLELDCPGMSGSTQRIDILEDSWDFETECGIDVRGSGVTFSGVVAYTFTDCLKACASHNMYRGPIKCVAAAFTQNLDISNVRGATCWLKNGTAGRTTAIANKTMRAVGWLRN